MKWVKTFKALSQTTFSLGALFIMGQASAIDLHIHQPEDLEKATQARTHFNNAGLPDVVTEERKRLQLVLNAELATVEENILARRDQELIYFIDNIESKDTFGRIQERISKRLTEMEVSEEAIKEYNRLKTMLTNEELAYQFSLDTFSLVTDVKSRPICSEKNNTFGVVEGLKEQLNIDARYELRKLQAKCEEILEIKKSLTAFKLTSPYSPDIADRISSLNAIENNSMSLAKRYMDTQKALKKAAEAKPSTNLTKQALQDINTFLCTDLPILEEEIEQHKKSCANYGIKLDDDDIQVTRFAAVEKLDILRAQQQQLNDILTTFIEADAYLAPDAKKPKDDLGRLSVFASVFKSFQNLDPSTFASALQFEVESLRLDALKAQKQIDSLKAEVALLKLQEASWLSEWEHLSLADRIRESLLGSDGTSPCSPTGLKKTKEGYHANVVVVLEQNAGEKKCKREIHRMLTELSNAWTFGYLPQQLAEYHRIALSHDSALDSSEIAFLRWQNLLAIPIDQLVTLHGTGIKPEDIASLIQALGLGSIAAGVN
jgi:hypothetical protein